MALDLDARAREILNKNDRGGYTVPTARLYPYQWNWDSAFVALGFATFDRARAWQELELLLEGQWGNGMIPHILFRRDDPDYFPGPSVWQTNGGAMPSGGISQPPVLASIVWELVQTGGAEDLARAGAMFDDILRWHRWYHRDRTPDGCPVVCTVHPWETGRDNCPDWNIGMDTMEVAPDLMAYQRMDTVHANAAQRPSKTQYDKYVTIIQFGRSVGWDQKRLTNEGPFLMADPGIHFILLRADRDLADLARACGREEALAEVEGFITKGVASSDYFWNPEVGAYCARDVRSGVFSDGVSNASVLAFYAGVGSEAQHQSTLAHMERIAAKVDFMMPSWDPDADTFEPQRYWCGPVWPQMNTIIAKGLAEQGHVDMATRVRRDLARVIEASGFFECFNPVTGEGCIGPNFSWTAALWLAWASNYRSDT